MRKMHRIGLFAVLLTMIGSAAHAQISTADFPTQANLTPNSPEDVLPPAFRGEINYKGFYRGKVYVPGRPPRQLNVNAFLSSALSGKSLPMAGDYNLKMVFDGYTVSGSMEAGDSIRGESVRLDPAKFTGRRSGAACYLTWSDGSESASYCGRSEYRQNINTTNLRGQKVAYSAQAQADKFIDYAERDRKRAAAEERRRAEQAKLNDLRKRNDSIVNGSGPLSERLDALAEIDSRSWLMSRYQAGSMNNVSKISIKDAKNYTAQGYFRYADGRSGSVMAEVRNGVFNCVKFGDEASCRPIGHPASHGVAAGLMGALIVDAFAAPSGGSGPSHGDIEQQRRAACINGGAGTMAGC